MALKLVVAIRKKSKWLQDQKKSKYHKPALCLRWEMTMTSLEKSSFWTMEAVDIFEKRFGYP